MISSEGPLLFSKACEIFIGEVAIRAWMNTCEKKRRTVQKSDVQVRGDFVPNNTYCPCHAIPPSHITDNLSARLVRSSLPSGRPQP